uniref:Candidate secreted effector n=1 Tax=Meloidogyne incognita TaxID=6306 RepID=A0A914L6J1_MELIC
MDPLAYKEMCLIFAYPSPLFPSLFPLFPPFLLLYINVPNKTNTFCLSLYSFPP